MAKQYPLDIDAIYSEDDMWIMSKGHHPFEDFSAEARRRGYGRESDEDEYYEFETPKHALMRSVPNSEGGTRFWPVDAPGPGVFPVTIALCYWVRPSRAERAAKIAQQLRGQCQDGAQQS